MRLKGELPDRGLGERTQSCIIAQKIGRQQVGKQRGWEYLKKCGYSPQRPRSRHRKGNGIEQERFKKNSFSRVRELQKRYPLNPIEVWSFDERRVGIKPILVKYGRQLEKDYHQLFITVMNRYIFTDLSIL